MQAACDKNRKPTQRTLGCVSVTLVLGTHLLPPPFYKLAPSVLDNKGLSYLGSPQWSLLQGIMGNGGCDLDLFTVTKRSQGHMADRRKASYDWMIYDHVICHVMNLIRIGI